MELAEYLRAKNALYRGHVATMRRINAEHDKIIASIRSTEILYILHAADARSAAFKSAYADLDDALYNLKYMYRTATNSSEVSNA